MSLAPGLRLDIKQTQGLVLTPQLQQAIRLLQMSNIELSSVLDREIAENPFLDHADRTGSAPTPSPPTPADTLVRSRPDADEDGWHQPSATRCADSSLQLRKSSAQAFDQPAGGIEARLTRPRTLREHLLEQIGGQVRDLRVRAVARALVDLLDEDGYLREPDDHLAPRLHTTEAVVTAAREALQACDPAGIGARDLAECLALQLAERDRLDPAMRALVTNLPLLARAEFAELMRRCAIDAEDLQEMIAEIKRLDPRPGRVLSLTEATTIVPDVFVYRGAGHTWRVELNSGNLPRVLVDRDYHADLSARQLDRHARDYMSERWQIGRAHV